MLGNRLTSSSPLLLPALMVVLTGIISAFFLLPSRPACAGGAIVYPSLPVCDPSYYITLREKGWMEAMREVQVNNTVITKPASVLTLSCFDQHVKQVSQGGSIFTNTGQNQANITNAINTTIGGSFSSFISANFSEPAVGAGVGFSSGGKYGDCKRLWQIWEQVKCAVVDPANGNNGFLLSSVDQFRTNADAGWDVRGTTGMPKCQAAQNPMKTRYTEGMKSSSDLADTGKKRYGAGSEDKYFSFARPNFCAYGPKEGAALGDGDICKLGNNAAKKCSEMPAIPTGLVVAYSGGQNNKDPFGNDLGTLYWSYRCLNPGCYFDVKDNANGIKAGGGPPPAKTCTHKPY